MAGLNCRGFYEHNPSDPTADDDPTSVPQLVAIGSRHLMKLLVDGFCSSYPPRDG